MATRPLHLHVLGQVDAAHAAGAQEAEQLVLANQEEALVAAFEQLVALPSGDDFGGDQLLGQDGAVGFGHGSKLGNDPIELIVFDQFATPQHFQQLVGASRDHEMSRTRGATFPVPTPASLGDAPNAAVRTCS